MNKTAGLVIPFGVMPLGAAVIAINAIYWVRREGAGPQREYPARELVRSTR